VFTQKAASVFFVLEMIKARQRTLCVWTVTADSYGGHTWHQRLIGILDLHFIQL
jgi:hypothetical protein